MDMHLFVVVSDLSWLSGKLMGTLFIVSALAKALDRIRFQDTLSAMELWPRWLSILLARWLVPTEMILGVMVLGGYWLDVTGPVLLGLLGSFSLVLVWYRWRGGVEIACGCFGDFRNKSRTSVLIMRNLLLIAAGVPLLRWPELAALARTAGDWYLAATAVVGIVLAWLLATRTLEAVRTMREFREEVLEG